MGYFQKKQISFWAGDFLTEEVNCTSDWNSCIPTKNLLYCSIALIYFLNYLKYRYSQTDSIFFYFEVLPEDKSEIVFNDLPPLWTPV